jgi:hypothetical protein
LKAALWFRRGRLLITSPVQQPYWLHSGQQSTYPDVQISRATSIGAFIAVVKQIDFGSETVNQ